LSCDTIVAYERYMGNGSQHIVRYMLTINTDLCLIGWRFHVLRTASYAVWMLGVDTLWVRVIMMQRGDWKNLWPTDYIDGWGTVSTNCFDDCATAWKANRNNLFV